MATRFFRHDPSVPGSTVPSASAARYPSYLAGMRGLGGRLVVIHGESGPDIARLGGLGAEAAKKEEGADTWDEVNKAVKTVSSEALQWYRASQLAAAAKKGNVAAAQALGASGAPPAPAPSGGGFDFGKVLPFLGVAAFLMFRR